MRMVVPAPGWLTTSMRPPSHPARRCIPINPIPSCVRRRAAAGSKPTPSSVTVMMPRPRDARRSILILDGAPWVFVNSTLLVRATRKNVEGFKLSPTQMFFDMEQVSLKK